MPAISIAWCLRQNIAAATPDRAAARARMDANAGHFAACECRAVTRNRFMAKMQTSIGTHIKAFTSLTRQTDGGAGS